MTTSRIPLAAIALSMVLTSAPLSAQDASPASATGYRKELIAQLDDAERKLIALAEATPQDKLGFRPAPGVRSVSEVLVHVGSANFFLPSLAGVKRERGVQLSRDMERTMTDKAQIIDLLRKSFVYAKQAVMDIPEAQMSDSVSLFGTPSTKRGTLLLIATHAHEHLGQSIAYARMNGITPPWSQQGGGND